MTPAPPGSRVLIVGDDGTLAAALAQKLGGARLHVQIDTARSDAQLKELFAADWQAIAVVTHDDVLALRLTLLCVHVAPTTPVWATIFDRSVADQLRSSAPHVTVLSTSEVAATALADDCEALIGRPHARWRSGVRVIDDALRLLVITGAGIVAMFCVEIVIGLLGLHEGLLDAVFYSSRILATIAEPPGSLEAPAWFKVVSVVDTVATIVLIAVFTAALVRRLGAPRLTTLFGARSCPARRHIVLIGLGQVGFRLAQELHRRGFPIVTCERDPNAPCLRLARRAGLAAIVARGDDIETLRRLGATRSALIAAVTSDDLVNVAIGLAAHQLSPSMKIVLRLGDGDVAAESESLLHLGHICDVHGAAMGALGTSILERIA